MAFDLVQYFSNQIQIQLPQLFQHIQKEQQEHIHNINILVLGQLVSAWKQNQQMLYQEIQALDPLYIQEVARHLTTSKHNQSVLKATELENAISDILSLQLIELKQLDQTGNLGITGLSELLLGQIEHLSGQAEDWVWSTNQLTELIGSKPIEQPEISIETTMQEFNQMVHQTQTSTHNNVEVLQPSIPMWSRIVAPLVALAILIFLYCSYNQLFIG